MFIRYSLASAASGAEGIEFAVLQKNRQPMQHRVTGSVQIQNGQTVAFDFIPVSVAIVVDANAPLFTLKALLLCAVPLFRSSSSDLAADYNVSLCGQNGNPAAYGASHGDEVSLRSLQLQRNHHMQAEAVCGHIHQMLSGCPKDPFRPRLNSEFPWSNSGAGAAIVLVLLSTSTPKFP